MGVNALGCGARCCAAGPARCAEIEAKLEQLAAEETRLARELSTARSVEKTVQEMIAENVKERKRLGCK